MNKKIIISLIIALIAFFVFLRMGDKSAVVENAPEVTSESLNQELDGLSDIDLGSELKEIDANVEKL